MKKQYTYAYFLLLLVAVIAPQQNTWAQGRKKGYFAPYQGHGLSKIALGGSVGITLFKNDLHGFLEARAQNSFMNFYATGDLSFRLTNYVSVRSSLGVYKLYGEPSGYAATTRIQETSPSVTSNNIEGYVAIVHDLFSKEHIDRGTMSWNIYALVGIGLTHFEPKDALTGEKLRLIPNPDYIFENIYSTNMSIFPVGIGFTYYLRDDQTLNFEVAYRFTTSDWLDHAWWQTSSSVTYDGYAFVGFRYQYTFLAGKNVGNGFHRRSYQKRAGKRKG